MWDGKYGRGMYKNFKNFFYNAYTCNVGFIPMYFLVFLNTSHKYKKKISNSPDGYLQSAVKPPTLLSVRATCGTVPSKLTAPTRSTVAVSEATVKVSTSCPAIGIATKLKIIVRSRFDCPR